MRRAFAGFRAGARRPGQARAGSSLGFGRAWCSGWAPIWARIWGGLGTGVSGGLGAGFGRAWGRSLGAGLGVRAWGGPGRALGPVLGPAWGSGSGRPRASRSPGLLLGLLLGLGPSPGPDGPGRVAGGPTRGWRTGEVLVRVVAPGGPGGSAERYRRRSLDRTHRALPVTRRFRIRPVGSPGGDQRVTRPGAASRTGPGAPCPGSAQRSVNQARAACTARSAADRHRYLRGSARLPPALDRRP
ncbi:hypothetical protein FB470_006164 [Amycolatopsis thermophila]|uniref:Uncharacterized protein n=1 Tax=Amycolatopsis thermophila TaxID=206084 RepID=A0ABU0F3L8_9PSEU|nr:hypothetical protein [Amycolatopsis thermophila]